MTPSRLIPLSLLGLSLLSGCASIQDKQARGNMIIIARYDAHSPEGRPGQDVPRATDNAGGVPSAAAGALGHPTTAAGGAALNVGAALATNLIASAIYKDRIFMAFKVLNEDKCEYDRVQLDLRTSPNSQNLYPGYIARVTNDKDDNLMLEPVTDSNGKQVYLAKSHPCYATWVAEWKLHQLVLANRGATWGTRKISYMFSTPPVIPDPELDWVK